MAGGDHCQPEDTRASATRITNQRVGPAADAASDILNQAVANRNVHALADAYARTGDFTRAGQWFAPATQFSTTPETLCNYAWFLNAQGKKDEAKEWLDRLMAKKRTLPGYMQRVERPWFRKGKALRKELGSKK